MRATVDGPARGQMLLEHLPAAVFQFSLDGHILLVNREGRRMFGLPKHPGRHFSELDGLVCEADGSPCELANFPLVRCLTDGRATPPRMIGVRRADGSMVWGMCSAAPIFEAEQLTGAVLVFPDVAACKHAEERVERSRLHCERIFHILADQSTDAIFRADPAGNCTYVNARWLACSGLSFEQSLDDGWVDAVHPDDRAWLHTRWLRAVTDGELWHDVEFRAVDRRGVVTWLRSTISPVLDADGTLVGYIGINQDVTAPYEAKQRENVMIEELNHRVKNAMATVVGLAAATARNSDSVESFVQTFTGRIHSMARLHEALARQQWVDLSITQIVSGALLDADGHVLRSGPALTVSARVAMPLGQALYELNANAVRHGALTQSGGRVSLSWTSAHDGRVQLEWREHDGPTIESPPRPGVGLTLLHGLIEQEIGGTLDLQFARDGLRAQLCFPIC